MKRIVILSSMAATAALGIAPVASAHGIWFAQRAQRHVAMIYGVGAEDLDALRRVPLLKGVYGWDDDYQPVKTTIKAAGPLAVVDSEGPITAVGAWMDYGMWSKTPDGAWHNKGKDEVPNAVISERNFKYAVAIVGKLEDKKPLPVLPEMPMQIVPVGKIPLDKGKPVTLRVVYKGKPVPGATVLHDTVNDPDQNPPGKTGADGTITFPVRNQGLNVVTAYFFAPPAEPAKYNRMEERATLSFTLPHLPE